MIPQITEINFPVNQSGEKLYTLHQATVNIADMGDRVITTQVRVDGAVTPTFIGSDGNDLAISFKGEKYILPIKEPQAQKGNESLNSLVDLTFQHWAIYQLKRYYFVELSSVGAGTAIPDKYEVPLSLNLQNFCTALNNVLGYYFHGKIVVDLNPNPAMPYDQEPALINISYSYIWDVIQKINDIYNRRWNLSYNATTDVYSIRIGYDTDELSHIFEYGYEGGLLKVERQVQSDSMKNIILGRGGNKNLPKLYFKDYSKYTPNDGEWTNGEFAPDPDAIPELVNIYFDSLRDSNFRKYVQGWAAQQGYEGHEYVPGQGWAYEKGYTDETFQPVEYVKDDASIAKYGELWGALQANDGIYPSIQNYEDDDLGRIDEIIAAEQVTSDDIEALADASIVKENISGKQITNSVAARTRLTSELKGEQFTIGQGLTGALSYTWFCKPATNNPAITIDTVRSFVKVYNVSTGQEVPAGTIPAGTYYYVATICIFNNGDAAESVTYGIQEVKSTSSDATQEAWKPTFDIWVKNIWGTTKGEDETPEEYVERVWTPILGDALGNEAAVVFSTGMLAVSSDYQFVINAVSYDTGKSRGGVDSEWRLTLVKSDAELDATGYYIPNANTGGNAQAGDHFFFIGIDMPHAYVVWAEKRLNQYKTNNGLGELSEISPTWVINLDKVRINTPETSDYGQVLADQLAVGARINLKSTQFIGASAITLYIQSLQYTWQEPTKDQPYIVPDIEVVLSDKIVAVKSAVEELSGQIDQIRQQYVSLENLEETIESIVSAKFLGKVPTSNSSVTPAEEQQQEQSPAPAPARKMLMKSAATKSAAAPDVPVGMRAMAADNTIIEDGAPSVLPSVREVSRVATEFKNIIFGDNFRAGAVGGRSWGIYKDKDGNSVIEADNLVVRKKLNVNELVVNQVSYVGGKQIWSAASIECIQVIDTAAGYECYFNQKEGTVKNLFMVGDVAYSQVFNPSNLEVRTYKRKVVSIGVDHIVLSKTDVSGTDIPEVGDIIVQYGNYTDADRQYVIIHDVIGGGYQRMLSGLDSVTAQGDEYYFAGYDPALRERWFVGNKGTNGQYAEYVNGQLNIKAIVNFMPQSTGLEQMEAYQKLVQIAQGNIETWFYDDITPTQTGAPTLTNYPVISWEVTDYENHIGDIYYSNTGKGYRFKRSGNGWAWEIISDAELAQIMAEVQNLQYLKAALNQDTVIAGGLVLTSLIQLGYKDTQDVRHIMAGVSGLGQNAQAPAAWFGGPMVDHELNPTATDYAKSLFRFDGTGYLAKGNITWDANGYGQVGGSGNNYAVKWDASGVRLGNGVYIGSDSDKTLGTILTLLNKFDSWFGFNEQHKTIYVKKQVIDGVETDINFAAYGEVTAGGVGGDTPVATTTLGGLLNVTSDADAQEQDEDKILVRRKNATSPNLWTLADLSSIGGGNVDAIKMNGTRIDPVNKIVDLGTILTEHQSLTAYRTASAQDIIDEAILEAIPTKLSDLSGDTTHRVVTDSQITAWNGKWNTPSNASVLTGITSAKVTAWDGAADKAHEHANKTSVLDKLKWDATNNAIYIGDSDNPISFYAFGEITAGGVGSGGGGGATYLYQLEDVPDYRTSYRGKYLRVKSDGSGVEWVDVTGGVSSVINLTGDITQSQLRTALGLGSLAYKSSLAATDIPSLDASKITSGTFADARIASAATWNAKQNSLGTGTNGQILSWQNGSPAWVAAPATGVTSVATGTGLTGGTITSSGTISINSTYQTYISHGETAYNSLGNYQPLATAINTSNIANQSVASAGKLKSALPSTLSGHSLSFFGGQPSIGTSAGNAYLGSSNDFNLFSFPQGLYHSATNANIQNIRIAWNTSSYWTDILTHPNGNNLWMRTVNSTVAGDWVEIYHSGNLTNNNQLTNGAGYITSSGSCAYATSAGNASQLNGRSDYYHSGNCNNTSTAWTCSNLTASGNASISGNVSIGITSSAYKFDVSQSVGGNFVAGVNNTGNINYQRNLILGNPNLSAGRALSCLALGTNDSTNNLGEVGFYYAGNGSTSNLLGFGVWGYPFLMTVGSNGSSTTPRIGIGLQTTKASYPLHISAATGDGSPAIWVGSTSSVAWNYMFSGIAPSQSSGNNTIIDVGTGHGVGNAAIFGHHYVSSGNNANHAFIAMYGCNYLVNCFYSGNVTIGTQNNTDYGERLYVAGNLVASGEVTAGSDARWKDNQTPVLNGIDIIRQLRPMTWTWNERFADKNYIGKQSAGLIAQQVTSVLPFAVRGNEENGFTLDYNVFHAYEISAIQSHETEIDRLRKRVAYLEKQLNINS